MNTLIKRSVSTATSKKKIVFSGIQPTGTPHLGNYLGALANWAKLQEADPITGESPLNYYSIVDLHAITMPQNPNELRRAKFDMAATLLACGVDPKRSVLFEQSQVRAHSELAWIFNCITPVGWLGRMTQWKSKLEKSAGTSHAESLSAVDLNSGLKMGLFDYPVLQAADILLYKATHVPVGEDQIQHLELARDIAKLFNKTFKQPVFPKPDVIVPPSAKRIMSLRDPNSKMSKSDPLEHSRINLVDSPEIIQAKIAKATTDSIRSVSYDPVERPGVSNLVSIYAAMLDIEIEEAVKDCANITSTKEFKTRVADAIIEKIKPIQTELVRLQADKGYVTQVLDEGANRANQIANETMEQVYKVVGLR